MLRRARILWFARLASAAVVVALVGVAAFAGRALERAHHASTASARAQLAVLGDVTSLQELLYQKGFSAEYMLTGDPRWLAELEASTRKFRTGLADIQRATRSARAVAIVTDIADEYAAYDRDRARALGMLQAGDRPGALALQVNNRDRAGRLKTLAADLVAARRAEVAAELEATTQTFRRTLIALLAVVTVAITIAGVLGYTLARRVGRPLYELVLRAESASTARVELSADDEISAIASHVTHLAREVEASSRALAEQRARVVQAEKMSALGEMAAAVAHEVLNPLAGIKVAMQLLARIEPSPTVQETVGAVDREIARVDRVARRLISFARPLQLDARAFDLPALLDRVLSSVGSDAASRQVVFKVEVEEAALGLRADPDLLEQVLINLTLNACQAIDGAGHVRVRARAVAPWRVIDVIDDGPGVAPEITPRLFLPFTTSRAEGHGLGLAVSQSIAVAHGGRIEARSNAPARGATFTVYLPEVA